MKWGVLFTDGVVYGPFPDPITAQHWARRAEDQVLFGKYKDTVKIIWPPRIY